MERDTTLSRQVQPLTALEGSNSSAMMFVDSLIDRATRKAQLLLENVTGEELRQLVEAEESSLESEESPLKSYDVSQVDWPVRLISEKISHSGGELIKFPARNTSQWLSTLDQEWVENIETEGMSPTEMLFKTLRKWPYSRRIKSLVITDPMESNVLELDEIVPALEHLSI